MTPAARIAAASDILDAALAGQAVEQVLTNWARGNRYAGSGDRAAIRDIVFDATRCRRSFAWLGGALSGRGLMLGRVLATGGDVDALFTGARHALLPVSAEERRGFGALEAAPRAVRLDMPDWLVPEIDRTLGAEADAVLERLRHRAPVFLRANLARAGRDAVISALAAEGYEARPHRLTETAVEVVGRVRGLAGTTAFSDGLFEFQDAASQAVVARALEGGDAGTVLDYCAGGGGKALAFAARGLAVTAQDADAPRMRDIPARSARAGVGVSVQTRAEGLFDLVFCDAPCSGSGAWRRQPEAKWTLDAARLADLNRVQDAILDEARGHVAPGGRLAYATCSLLGVENGDRADAFVARHPDWREVDRLSLTPLDGGDGFFLAVFARI